VADKRTVTIDIDANDNTHRATDSAGDNFERLDRRARKSSRDRNRDLDKDAKKAVSIFDGLFGGLVKQGQKSGLLAGEETIDGFGAAFKALPPEVKIGMAAGLAGAAVAAAPAIVAVVNAAMLTGVGAGGLAAGIALAARDPQVDAAFTNLGAHVQSRLEKSATPFRAELIGSAQIFGDAFDRQAGRVDRIFTTLSSTVRPLAAGLSQGLENALPGVERAAQAAAPLLRDIARELPTIGRLIGQMFDAIAKGGPGADLALNFILSNVEALILGLTYLIDTLGGAANGVAVLNDKSHLLAQTIAGHPLREYAVQLATTGSAAQGMAGAVYNTAQAADQANAAFDRLFGELLNVDQANLAVKAGMATLTSTIKGNAKTLDENTAAGRANVGAILGQVEALDRKRQADIAAGNGTKTATDKANAAYAAQVQSLRAVLIQLGLTAAQVDNLIGKYEAIPRDISTTITTHYRQDGTPSAGHSRITNGLDGAVGSWGPAQFAARQFAAADDRGHSRTQPPTRVESNVDVAVLLDGDPVRRIAKRVTLHEARLAEWRRGRR
jgi:hypothetical protein